MNIEDENSDAYFLKMDAMKAIERAERDAKLAPFGFMGLSGGLAWFAGVENEWLMVVSVVGGGVLGNIIAELYRLRVLLFKMELRELSRFGVEDDRELTAIRREIAAQRGRRWWPFG